VCVILLLCCWCCWWFSRADNWLPQQKGEKKEAKEKEGKEKEHKDEERSPEEIRKAEAAVKAAADKVEEEKRLAEEKRVAEEKQRKLESMCGNVVPKSSRLLTEDAEFALYRVVVLKKGQEVFKSLCRERRYTIREFKYDPSQDEANKRNLEALEKHKKKLWSYIVNWCKATYSDVFKAWIHIKAMRVFVEAVLRFGLPVDFTAALLLPGKGQDAKLRVALKQLYAHLSSANLTQALDSSEMDISGFGADFYPYVYLQINLTD